MVTEAVKGLDPQEGIGLALMFLPIAQEIAKDVKAFNAIPPADRTPLDVAPMIGVTEGSVLYKVLEAASTPADFKPSDVIGILELEPQGNLGQLLTFADRLLEAINS